ncbi:MAG: glycosyltransferase [Gammaproteobacteria bacterium]|nr:glycosyltransferase [Gammaproteobacteria bacterium]
MSKKNIAIYIDSLAGGGAERVMLDIAKYLTELGHKVVFFLLEPVIDYEVAPQIKYHVLYQTGKRSKFTNRFHIKKTAADMTRLVEHVASKEGRFDLHLSNLDSTNHVLSRCHFENTYYVIHNAISQEIKRAKKSQIFRYFKTLREKRVLNGKDLIAVSNGITEEIKNTDFISPKSVQTIYNPCDIEFVRAQAKVANEQIPDIPYLIHIGRVVKQKRHDVLFKALQNVPNIPLVLLCKNVKKAKKLADKYGVTERIIFAGFQTNPYNWIANAKLMVFSSDFEGLGMVLVESLACNTPVVSTNCPYGPNEILTRELANNLVPVADADALAKRINAVLNTASTIDFNSHIEKFRLECIALQYLKLAETSN